MDVFSLALGFPQVPFHADAEEAVLMTDMRVTPHRTAPMHSVLAPSFTGPSPPSLLRAAEQPLCMGSFHLALSYSMHADTHSFSGSTLQHVFVWRTTAHTQGPLQRVCAV